MPSTISLGEVLDVQNGFAFKSELFSDGDAGMPLIRIRDLKKSCTEVRFIGEYKEEYVVNTGDYLIGMDGDFEIHQWQGEPALLNQRVCRLKGFSNNIEPEYVYYAIQEKLREIHENTAFVTVKHLSSKQIKSIKIPFHPIEEQRRIVDILKRADGIRRLRKQAQDTARQLIPALFIDMFGDGREARVFSTATIQELAEPRKGSIRTGPFGSQLKHSEFTDSGIPVLGIDNVVTNQFRWTTERYLPPEKYQKFKRFRVFPGDIIVTIMGTTGRIVVTPDDLPESMSTKHLCVVSLQKDVIQPCYAWASILFDPYVRSQIGVSGHGAIMEGWNTSIVKNLRLRLPPIQTQNEFVARIESIQSILRQQEVAQSSAESSFQSLLHRAFNGVR